MYDCISFFDLAPGLTGFCSGTGEGRPDCGAFRLPATDDDLGLIGLTFERWVETHIQTYRPTCIGYESPILVPHDRLMKVRKIYGLGMVLETVAARHQIPTFEAGLRELKRELTGNPKAEKADMVEAALLCGIDLPPTKADGKEDAADAFAGWLIGLRELSPNLSRRWDKIVFSKGRGGLI